MSISEAVEQLILWICTRFYFHLEKFKAKLNVIIILGRVCMQRFSTIPFEAILSITPVSGVHLLTDFVTEEHSSALINHVCDSKLF